MFTGPCEWRGQVTVCMQLDMSTSCVCMHENGHPTCRCVAPQNLWLVCGGGKCGERGCLEI